MDANTETGTTAKSKPKKVTSPLASGGAGHSFETHVGAVFLATLIVGGIPPVLVDCRIKQVHFQTEHKGWNTDDILVVSTDGSGIDRNLAVQVKRAFTVSSKDAECVKAILDFWHDFKKGDEFREGLDAFLIVTLQGTKVLLQSLVPLLDSARASLDEDDFESRLDKDGPLNNKSIAYADELRIIINEDEDEQVSGNDFWRFLKSIHLLSYDLGTSTNQTKANICTLLSHSTKESDPMAVAEATWGGLLEFAGNKMSSAGSFDRNSLPSKFLKHHSATNTAVLQSLNTLEDHTRTTLRRIKCVVGEGTSIPRPRLVSSVIQALENNRILIISGNAGFGKSVIAKSVCDELASNAPVLVFRAEEFEEAHLDATLQRAQVTLGAEHVFSQFAAQGRKVLLIESLERLLEASTRESFNDLLSFVKEDENWRMLITCRSYSTEIVRTSFLQNAGLTSTVIEILGLDDSELTGVFEKIPKLKPLSSNLRLYELLRSPYLLDKASQMHWPEGQSYPENEKSFRKKFWNETIRDDTCVLNGINMKREAAFIDVAVRRAQTLSQFVGIENSDSAAINKLLSQDVLVSKEGTSLVSPAHDVLEDWAIIEWFDQQYSSSDQTASSLEKMVKGYPAIRRSYRLWLNELLELDTSTADKIVVSAIQSNELPSYFQDDTMVAMLLSTSAAGFIERNAQSLKDNDFTLLKRAIHLLRVACKTNSPWIKDIRDLPSAFLVPHGSAWSPVLSLVAQSVDKLLPAHIGLVVGFIEDWAKLISWKTPYPEGAKDAVSILFSCIPHLSRYGRSDMVQRILKIAVRIPLANKDGFLDLITRGIAKDNDDWVADEFTDLVLDDTDGWSLCKEFPNQMIQLAESHFYLHESDLPKRARYDHSTNIEPMFGVPDNYQFKGHPASAIRGVFNTLLWHHPNEGVSFIVRLLNHSGEWYSKQLHPSFALEPSTQVTIQVDSDTQVEQCANDRLWRMYRGQSVAPDILQSALMALEAWLLKLAELESEYLESWLLKCIRESTNVATTAVVASVCTAYPSQAGKAGLAILKCREFYDFDRGRMASESSVNAIGFLSGMNIENVVYENERKESNSLPHRRNDLENLAQNMQLGNHRESVWKIFDTHLALLPTKEEQDDEDKLWRLALHRMDIRGYRPISKSDSEPVSSLSEEAKQEIEEEIENGRIYLSPGEPDKDIQDMIERVHPQAQVEQNQTNMSMYLWGQKAWESTEGTSHADWNGFLQTARNAKNQDSELYSPFAMHGPGFVACVCARDHWDNLEPEDQKWCVETIIKSVEHNDESDTIASIQRNSMDASRPSAFMCSFLIDKLGFETNEGHLLHALAQALTHPVDEVVDYAANGVSKYLSQNHSDWVMSCSRRMVHMAHEINELDAEEAKKPYDTRLSYSQIRYAVSQQICDQICCLDSKGYGSVTDLDLDTWSGRASARIIFTLLSISSCEDDSKEFYKHVVHWIVQTWNEDRNSRNRNRHFESEHNFLHQLASSVIKLTPQDALEICTPLAESMDINDDGLSYFLSDLICSEDRADGSTSFWDIWQLFADHLAASALIEQCVQNGRDRVPKIVSLVFLGISWKEGIQHWKHLEGESQRIDTLFSTLPACVNVLEAYVRYLATIGGSSLPRAFVAIADRIKSINATTTAININIEFDLESVLRRFVYGQPRLIKESATMRDAVLYILDVLVDSGSSAAYRMRDDFVTPLGGQKLADAR